MREYIKRNRQLYNELADQYQQRCENRSIYEYNPRKLVQYVIENYEKEYGVMPVKILELGPGAGASLKIFSEYKCITTAIEFSTKMAQIAHANSPYTVFLIKDVMNCRNLLYKQFDIIYASAFIHLFPLEDERRLLKKMRQWLSKDGLIYLNTTLHNISEEGYFTKEDYVGKTQHFRRRWEKKDFISFLKSCGFEVLDVFENEERDRKKHWINILLRKKVVH